MTPPSISELLALWIETRSPEVAALVERLSVITERPPITGGSQRALHAAWLAVEEAGDPLDIDRLIAALAHGNLNQARERLARLAARPADPRIAAGLEALVEAPPSVAFVKSTSTPLWNDVFALLGRIADPRTRTIADRVAWLAHDRAASPFDVGKLRSRTAKAVARTVAAIPPAAPLTPAQRARVDELAARVTTTATGDRGAELLARIYDEPGDVHARAVYADWLSANGDPRGEFIALQLAHPPSPQRPWRAARGEGSSTRERNLLRTHRQVWLGRLGPFLRWVRFERGFPAHAGLEHRIDVRTLAAIREAATLEHLRIGEDDREIGLALTDAPFHLRSIGDCGWRTLAGILAGSPSTIQAVEIHGEGLPPDPGFLERDATLAELDLATGHTSSPPPSSEAVHAFVRTRVIDRLQTLYVSSNVKNDTAFVEAFATSRIARLLLASWWDKVALSIERDGDALHATFDITEPDTALAAAQVRRRVERVPRGLVRSVTVIDHVDARDEVSAAAAGLAR